MFNDNLYLVIRKEFVDLRDSTMRDWSSEINRPWNGDKDVIYPNGSQLMFRHGEDIDSLKNINLGGALMVQAEEMSEQNFWFILGRLRRKSGTLKLRIEANYDGHNWIYKLFKKKEINIPPAMHGIISKDDFDLIETNTVENKDNLPVQYIASLEILPEKLRKRNYIGSWDDAQGLVYDEYSDDKHVIEPFDVPDTWERGFILDHGFTNPTAVLWYAIDYDGNIILYDEHYQCEKSVSYHAEQILKRGINNGYCDPSVFARTQSRGSELYSIADEYSDFKVTLRPATKASEASSIARVNEFFKGGKIRVFSTLGNFRNEISNWKYRKLTNRTLLNLSEEPEDKDNHLMDDLKYLIASRFAKSEKPKEIPKPYSIEAYDRRSQLIKEKQEEQKGIW